MRNKRDPLFYYIAAAVLIPMALFFVAQLLEMDYQYYDYGLFCALGIIVIFSIFYGMVPGLMLCGILIFVYGSVIFYQLMLGYSQTWTLNYIWFAFYPLSAFIGGKINQILEKQAGLLDQCRTLTDKIVSIDELTGFGNGRELLRDLDREMSRSKRYKHPLTLMVVQIQYYEELKSIYGDDSEGLLKDLSAIIDNALRIEDLRFKLEDDLFALILPHTALDDSMVVKQRINANIDNMAIEDKSSLKRYRVEIRVGACEYKKDIPNPMAFKALALKELEYDV